jgi:hypothetical protein
MLMSTALSHPAYSAFYGVVLGLSGGMSVLAVAFFAIFQVGRDPFWYRLGVASATLGALVLGISMVAGIAGWFVGMLRQSVAGSALLLNLASFSVFAGTSWVHARFWVDPSIVHAGPAILLMFVGLGLILGAGWRAWILCQGLEDVYGAKGEQAEPAMATDRKAA